MNALALNGILDVYEGKNGGGIESRLRFVEEELVAERTLRRDLATMVSGLHDKVLVMQASMDALHERLAGYGRVTKTVECLVDDVRDVREVEREVGALDTRTQIEFGEVQGRFGKLAERLAAVEFLVGLVQGLENDADVSEADEEELAAWPEVKGSSERAAVRRLHRHGGPMKRYGLVASMAKETGSTHNRMNAVISRLEQKGVVECREKGTSRSVVRLTPDDSE